MNKELTKLSFSFRISLLFTTVMLFTFVSTSYAYFTKSISNTGNIIKTGNFGKQDANVTNPAAVSGLIYNGTSQELITNGETDGGEWQYKLSGGEYSTTIPTGINATTYTIYYKLVGGDDYNDIAEASFDVTIAKASQSAPAAPEKASATSTSVTLTALTTTGQGATKYGRNTTNATPTTWQDSVEFTDLETDTTYYFFAKYVGNDNYDEAISTATEIKTLSVIVWNSLSKEITTSSGTQTVNYLPVFANDAAPANITFAYKSGETYTVIENPEMSDLSSYAISGTLYYSGNGTLETVRAVKISYNNVWKTDDAYSYPYYASCAFNDLQNGIKEKIASNGSETVEKLAMETIGNPSNTPTINGVSVAAIYNVYKNDSNFGDNGEFLSCVAYSSNSAYVYFCEYDAWMTEMRSIEDSYVIISRIFN